MGESRFKKLVKAKPGNKSLPVLPVPVARICCVLNFMIPGLGLFLAGFAGVCCGQKEDRCLNCCVSCCLSVIILLTTPLLLLGWICSCVMGVLLVDAATEARDERIAENQIYPIDTQPTHSSVNVYPSAVGDEYSSSHPAVTFPELPNQDSHFQPIMTQPKVKATPKTTTPPPYSISSKIEMDPPQRNSSEESLHHPTQKFLSPM